MENYNIDYDWAWGTPHPGDPVTLRAHLSFQDGATANRAVSAFFNALMEENGFHGSGGWAAREVESTEPATRLIDFVAGGEDVADAISYAAEDAVEHFSRFDASVRWEQLPY